MTLNETITTTSYPIPPVNTGGTGPELFMQQVILAGILSFIFAVIIIMLIRRSNKANKDIDPTIDDLMSDPYNPNTAMIVMLVVLMPLLIGVLSGLQWLFIDTAIGGVLIVGSMAFTIIPFLMMKMHSRDQTRHTKKMEGPLYLKNGKKRKYYFAHVDFDAEKTISNVDREAILSTKGMTKKILDKLHPVPAKINRKFNVYFLFEGPFADAIAWMDDDEFDYYGSYTTKADGPVLKEITKIQRVQTNPEDEDDLVNEYTFVFWVMFDDSHAVIRQSGQQLVDLTDNEMFAGLTKAVTADRKVLAGEMNATTEELAGYKNDDRSFEAKVNNRANGLADGLAADKEALSMLDKIGMGVDLKYWLTIAVVFIFGTIFGLYQGGG